MAERDAKKVSYRWCYAWMAMAIAFIIFDYSETAFWGATIMSGIMAVRADIIWDEQ